MLRCARTMHAMQFALGDGVIQSDYLAGHRMDDVDHVLQTVLMSCPWQAHGAQGFHSVSRVLTQGSFRTGADWQQIDPRERRGEILKQFSELAK